MTPTEHGTDPTAAERRDRDIADDESAGCVLDPNNRVLRRGRVALH